MAGLATRDMIRPWYKQTLNLAIYFQIQGILWVNRPIEGCEEMKLKLKFLLPDVVIIQIQHNAIF